MYDGITLKGDVQDGFRSAIAWLFDAENPLSWRDWALFYYALWLGVASVAVLAVSLLAGTAPNGPRWPLLVLAGAALIAEGQTVRLSARAEMSVAFLPIVLAAVIYGPVGAICVGVFSLVLAFRKPYGRWFLWTSTRTIVAGCAGMVAMSVAKPGEASFSRLLAAVAAATLVEQGGDVLLGAVIARLRGATPLEIGRVASAVAVTVPLYTPIMTLLVYTYREVSPWSVALFLFPAFAAQKLFLLYKEQRATAEELGRAIVRQERANLSFATALVATLDARDRYTAGHSAAVAVYARDIAKRLGLSEDEQRLVHLAGLVHDIGKVGLPPGLLEKPGPLTRDERVQMEQHSVIGERILARVEDYDEIAKIVRHHHERVDGVGYPDGLRNGSIPLLSRIIAVADAYNAMTSQRPYRDAMPPSVARMRLAQGVDTQFDTAVVAAFEAVLVGADDGYRAGRQGEFDFEFEAAPQRPRLVAVASA